MSASARPVVAGLAGSAAVIAAITIVARITGFGRTIAFSGAVGTQGCLGTAYATANRLPNVLFEVAAGGALAGAVVPVLAGRLAASRKEEADQVASAVLTWTVVLLAPLSVVLALLAGPLTRLLLDSNQKGCSWTPHTAAVMLAVFAPQVVLYGIGIVLAGILQAHRRFAWPAVAPLLSSLTVVGAYLVFGALASGAQDAVDWRPDGAEIAVPGPAAPPSGSSRSACPCSFRCCGRAYGCGRPCASRPGRPRRSGGWRWPGWARCSPSRSP